MNNVEVAQHDLLEGLKKSRHNNIYLIITPHQPHQIGVRGEDAEAAYDVIFDLGWKVALAPKNAIRDSYAAIRKAPTLIHPNGVHVDFLKS